MAKIWWSSDPHLGHDNIIKYCDRPFKDSDEMNEVIIARHNAVVSPQDHWYSMGDVVISKRYLGLIKRFNGHKRLLMGNHDVYTSQQYMDAGFEKVMAYRVIDNIIFSHIPIHPESLGRFRANVHGHIHNHPGYGWPYINLSMEAIDYTPVAHEDLVKYIEQEEKRRPPRVHKLH